MSSKKREHPIAKGTYLEPWRSAESESYPSWGALWAGPYKWLAEFERDDLAERAAACVNAMAGIEDPEEWMAAMREVGPVHGPVEYAKLRESHAQLLEAATNFMTAVAVAEPTATRGMGYPLDVGIKMLALREAVQQARGLSILQPEGGE